MITQDRAQEILDGDPEWNDKRPDAALAKGLIILLKHDPQMDTAAEHDILYAANLEKTLETLTEEEVVELRKCGWLMNIENDGWMCFT